MKVIRKNYISFYLNLDNTFFSYLEDIQYLMLSILPKQPTFSQIREGTRQRWFLFSKILQLFDQKVTGWLFGYSA